MSTCGMCYDCQFVRLQAFWLLRPSPPLEFPTILLGVGLYIFWSHTIRPYNYLSQETDIELLQGIPFLHSITDNYRNIGEEVVISYAALTYVRNSLEFSEFSADIAIFFGQLIINIIGIINDALTIIHYRPVPVWEALIVRRLKKKKIQKQTNK